MSTFRQIFDIQEQICYVQCAYCATFLLVSVPFRSLSMVVTVRCGHCTSLLSVNMKIASFLPLNLFGSLNQDAQPKIEDCPEEVDGPKALEKKGSSSDEDEDEEEDSVPVNHVINKPPEKRQRAPSAYNCFIKEEIRRLKAENPNITHKKAFSTAAKNWAHFPLSQQKGTGESCSQGERKMAKCSDVDQEAHVEGNDISESKASWHSIVKDTRPLE